MLPCLGVLTTVWMAMPTLKEDLKNHQKLRLQLYDSKEYPHIFN